MVGKQGAWKDKALVLAFVALAGLGGYGLLALGDGDAAADARLAALEAEAEQMDVALDAVEERLLGNQAQLQLWAELGRRHKQVSAVHTQRSGAHFEAMVAYMERTQEKARGLKRRRVASAEPVLTSGRQRRGGGTD
jgi:hypothetical protein